MAITDSLRDGHDALLDRVRAAEGGGATCIQVRLKDEPARVVTDVTRAIIRAVRIPVLVNDRFDIALAAGAAGVHLGADDVPAGMVRQHTPPSFIIGVSVGCDAELANAEHADFVGIGPVFGTGSKSDAGAAIGVAELTRLARAAGKPAVGIGGITAQSAGDVIRGGAHGVAVISAIFAAPDPQTATTAIATAVAHAVTNTVTHDL
jgi:thiamine-phosphate pyrophosphorylase